MNKVYPLKKWLVPSFWHIFLGFYFIKFYFSPWPFDGMWICLLALVIYLMAYYWGYYQEDRNKQLAAIVMIVSGIMASPYNTGACVFFQFAAFYIGLSSPARVAFPALAVVVLIILLLTQTYDIPVFNYTIPGILVSSALCFFGVFERVNQINKKKLAENEREIMRLDAIAERERIARDLHDVLGHTLTVIFLKCDVAKKLLYKDRLDDVYSELVHIETAARQTSKTLQDIIVNYRDINLTQEINNLVILLEQLKYTVIADIDIDPLPDKKIQQSLSLIIRESITNVIRHAQADRCEISLTSNQGQLFLKIKDNGQTQNEIRHGNGLKGMHDRVKLLNGSIKLTHDVQGTTIAVVIPLD